MPCDKDSYWRLERARRLRQKMSVSEKILWERLRDRKIGFKVRRQHCIPPYFPDFYCAEAMLCVETDGEQHARRVGKDAERDAFVFSQAIETLRLPTLDLFGGMESCLLRIQECCEERSRRPAFVEASWRGYSRIHGFVRNPHPQPLSLPLVPRVRARGDLSAISVPRRPRSRSACLRG